MVFGNGLLDPFCVLLSLHMKSFSFFDVPPRFASVNINAPEQRSLSFVGIKNHLQIFCRAKAVLRATPA